MSVGQLMSSPEGGFGRILKRARAIERLGKKVSGLLDPDLAGICQVANVRDGRLIFVCKSSGGATKLRMQAPALLKQLHDVGLGEIEEIEVKMRPPA